jgi:thiamine biosynthesis lipoprotein
MPKPKALLLLVSCLIAACGTADTADTHKRTIIALGTIIEIEIYAAKKSQADQALDQTEDFFQLIQRDWYAFGDGELGQANNALSQGKSVELSPELAGLVQRSLKLRQLSDGFFDPTIGALVELWGFHDSESPHNEPPPEAEIKRWQANLPARNSLSIVNNTISADGPLKLDFGGIAKGTALAGAAALLKQLGIEHALVNAGGDLQALGARGNRKWRIGIQDPHSNGVLGTIALEPGEAIMTSGNYERYFNFRGQQYHHLLDPYTGRPVIQTAGVTVVDFNPELADAAATALMVAGPERFRQIATQMGIQFAMLVTTGGDVLMTPRMADRIE